MTPKPASAVSLSIAALISCLLAAGAWAQEQPDRPTGRRGRGDAAQQHQPPQGEPATRPADRPEQGEADAEEPKPAAEQPEYKDLTTTNHEINGGLKYRATAGMQPMKDDQGKLRGNMFFVYYAALGADGKALHESGNRPITYVFNGGPGAASIWLHLGTAGPYRVPMGELGEQARPPYKVAENPNTWLDTTDLCFIDPIGTGFSRAAGDEPNERMFYGVHEDRQWVAEFIRLHATRFERWEDPKFLAGESYGTTRAAQLASFLHSRYGLDMNGIILISAVLDFSTIREAENNPLPFVLFMPTYTASAHWHKKLPTELQGDLEKALDEAEKFALDEYLPAISKGSALSEEERQQVAEKYARLTGLPVDYVLKSDLRVGPHRFMKALLNDQRKVIGRMDGRIAGFDTDPISDTPNFDPALSGYVGVYTGAFNDYVRGKLAFKNDLPYEALAGVGPWQGTPEVSRNYSGGYLNVADDLREAIINVPSMRVLLASGRYDLATPYFASDYTIEQMRLPPELRGNVTTQYYGGGHMMYHVIEEQEKLHQDVRSFIQAALEAPAP